MKRRLMSGWLVLVCAAAVFCAAKDQPSLAELKSRADSAKIQDQPHLYIDVADRQLSTATQQYDTGNSEAAQAAVQDVATYGQKAGDAAIKARKHLKDTEISLRKIVVKLRDLKRVVSFEDRQPIQTAIDILEDMRTQLLSNMFTKD